jgi:hypothetical protein
MDGLTDGPPKMTYPKRSPKRLSAVSQILDRRVLIVSRSFSHFRHGRVLITSIQISEKRQQQKEGRT